MQQLASQHVPRLPLFVHDLRVATSFYCDVIKATVLTAGTHRAHMRLPDGSLLDLVDLNPSDSETTELDVVQPTFEEWFSRRVRCRVASTTLHDWERHLFLNGVVVNRNFTEESNGIDLSFADPDGNLLVLVGEPDAG